MFLGLEQSESWQRCLIASRCSCRSPWLLRISSSTRGEEARRRVDDTEEKDKRRRDGGEDDTERMEHMGRREGRKCKTLRATRSGDMEKDVMEHGERPSRTNATLGKTIQKRTTPRETVWRKTVRAKRMTRKEQHGARNNVVTEAAWNKNVGKSQPQRTKQRLHVR